MKKILALLAFLPVLAFGQGSTPVRITYVSPGVYILNTSGVTTYQHGSGETQEFKSGAVLKFDSGSLIQGPLTLQAISAPGTPAAGYGVLYLDSTSKNFAAKGDGGVVNHGVQTKAVVSHFFLTGIADDGTGATGQPAQADVTGLTTADAPQFARLGVGVASESRTGLLMSGNITAASFVGFGARLLPTLVAVENADALSGMQLSPTYATGTFTGLNAYGVYGNVANSSGTGTIDNAYIFYADTASVGTNNWAFYATSFAGKSFFGNTTDATSTSDGAMQVRGGMSVAKKLFVGSDLNVTGQINGGSLNRVTADVTVTNSAAAADVTGLSVTLLAGQTYTFVCKLYVGTTGATATCGFKAGLAAGGGLTATDLQWGAVYAYGLATNGPGGLPVYSQRSNSFTTLGADTVGLVNAVAEISGTITVNVGGTLTIQGAQNTAASACTAVFRRGSFLKVEKY